MNRTMLQIIFTSKGSTSKEYTWNTDRDMVVATMAARGYKVKSQVVVEVKDFYKHFHYPYPKP